MVVFSSKGVTVEEPRDTNTKRNIVGKFFVGLSSISLIVAICYALYLYLA